MNKGDGRGAKGPTSGSSGSGRSNPNPNPLVRPPAAPLPPPAPKRPALRPIGGVKPPAIRPLNVRPMTAPKPPANIKLPHPPPPRPPESEEDATSVMDRSALFDPRELLEEMPATVGRFPQNRPAAGAPAPAPAARHPAAPAIAPPQPQQQRQRWPSDAAWPPPSEHRPARPVIDVVPTAQRTKSERTAVMPESPQRVLSPRTASKQTSSGLGNAPANMRVPATARGHAGLPTREREQPPAHREPAPSVPDLDALLPPIGEQRSISNRPRIDDLPPAPANTSTSPMAPMLGGRARPTPPPRPHAPPPPPPPAVAEAQAYELPSFPPPPNPIPSVPPPPGTVPLPLESSAPDETLAMRAPQVPPFGYGGRSVPPPHFQHQHHSQYPHAYTPSAPPVAVYSNYPPPPVQPNARAAMSMHPGGAYSPAAPMPLAMEIAATMPAVGQPPGILGFVLFAAPLALSTAVIAALTLL